ncbi:hypothetical protein FACS1894184_20270 [Clostridia bacterium]|nr:hypothetical protein FACS1894184_20270 [Clostridia bacterium]
MKTVAELLHVADICEASGKECDISCPYLTNIVCTEDMLDDAVGIVRQQQAEIKRLTRERDAAIRDIKLTTHSYLCKHRRENDNDCDCLSCDDNCDEFEWRGLCAENGGTNE